MAVPKRRTSKSKKNKRRNHVRAYPVAVQVCPRCNSPKRPHRVCGDCGYYAGKKEIEVKDSAA
ncbi:MAG: 50S ribosomal protein L32 [Gemmatimonadetes bacterium]|jgi:large subunit ribosomal protein L32|nr:50S ribosomal protein L32 [Gemmatimonadota bacterium]